MLVAIPHRYRLGGFHCLRRQRRGALLGAEFGRDISNLGRSGECLRICLVLA